MSDETKPECDTFLEPELDAIMEDASDALEMVRRRLKEYGGTIPEQSEQVTRWLCDLCERFKVAPCGKVMITMPMLHLLSAYAMVLAARMTTDPRLVDITSHEAKRINDALHAPPKPSGTLN